MEGSGEGGADTGEGTGPIEGEVMGTGSTEPPTRKGEQGQGLGMRLSP